MNPSKHLSNRVLKAYWDLTIALLEAGFTNEANHILNHCLDLSPIAANRFIQRQVEIILDNLKSDSLTDSQLLQIQKIESTIYRDRTVLPALDNRFSRPAPPPLVEPYIPRPGLEEAYNQITKPGSPAWILIISGLNGSGKTAFLQSKWQAGKEQKHVLVYLNLQLEKTLYDLVDVFYTSFRDIVSSEVSSKLAQLLINLDNDFREQTQEDEARWKSAHSFAIQFSQLLQTIGDRPVRVFTDALENLSDTRTKSWLLDIMLPALKQALPSLVTILTSQHYAWYELKAAPNLKPEMYLAVEIQPLNPERARQFLEAMGIEERLTERLINISRLPGGLRVLAKSFLYKEIDEEEIRQADIDFLFVHTLGQLNLSPELINLLRYALLLPQFDLEVLKEASGDNIKRDLWNEFHSWTMVQKVTKQSSTEPLSFQIHEELKKLRPSIAENYFGPQATRAIHQRVARYLLKRIESERSEILSSFSNQILISNAFYHLNQASELEEMQQLLLREFAKAVVSESELGWDYGDYLLLIVSENIQIESSLEKLLEILKTGKDAIIEHKNMLYALPMLNLLIKNSENQLEVQRKLIRIYSSICIQEKQNLNEALEIISNFTTRHPRDIQMLLVKANIENAFEQSEKALNTLDKIIQIGQPEKELVPAYVSKAQILSDLSNNLEQAREVLVQARQIAEAQPFPTKGEMLLSIGDGFWNIFDDSSVALECYLQATNGDHSSTAWQRIGDLYWYGMDDLAKAIVAYEKAFEVDMSNDQPLLKIISMLINKKDWEAVKTVCHRMQTEVQTPDAHEHAILTLALVEIMTNTLDNAEVILRSLPYEDEETLAKRYVVIANWLEAENNWEKAVEIYYRLGTMDHSQRSVSWERASYLLLWKLEESSKSLLAADEGLAIDPHRGNLYYSKAVALRRENRLEEALQVLEQMLQADPSLSVRAHRLAAWIYASDLNQKDLALQEIESAWKMSDEEEEQLYLLAEKYEIEEHWDEAIAIHREIAKRPRQNRAAALEYIGDLYRDGLRDLEKAVQSYHEALQVDPDQITAQIGMIRAYEAFEQWEQAADAYVYLAENWREYRTDGLSQGAISLAKAGNSVRAEQVLIQMEDEGINRVDLFMARASVYEQIDEWEKAAAVHAQIAEISEKRRPDALLQVGSIYLEELEKPREALEHFYMTLPLWGEDPATVQMQIARALEIVGDLVQSQQVYQQLYESLNKMLQKDASNVYTQRRIAWVLYKTNQLDEAISWLEKLSKGSRKKGTNYTRSRLILASIQYLRSNRNLAFEIVKELVKQYPIDKGLIWEANHDLEAVARQYYPDCDTNEFSLWLKLTPAH